MATAPRHVEQQPASREISEQSEPAAVSPAAALPALTCGRSRRLMPGVRPMYRHSRHHKATFCVVVTVVISACWPLIQPSEEWKSSNSSSRIRVNGQRVLDPGGPVSFEIPNAWKLKEGSRSGHLTIVREVSDASCWVALKEGGSTDFEAEFKAMKLVVPMAGGSWSRTEERRRSLGGKEAGELVGWREYPGEVPFQVRNLVVIYVTKVYLLECASPAGSEEEVRLEIERFLSSFKWGRAAKRSV